MPPDQQVSPDPPKVCILLALFQGAPYLRDQLDSFADQTHACWSLIASDDGSHDATREIVAGFQAAHPARAITCLAGAGQGFAHNFLALLQRVPCDVPFAALSDQDDVWFPDKLARAVRMLGAVPRAVPGLYCAPTLTCDRDLVVLGRSRVFRRAPDFRNALVQSIGGGNTMVLNRAALDLVAAAAGEASAPVAHDWWLYQVISGCGGQVIRDTDPVLYYRQHATNLIGANLSPFAILSRGLALLQGRLRRWNDTGLAALAASAHRFTPEARTAMQSYGAARTGPVFARLRALRLSGIYRQSRLGTVALYLLCLLRRL